MKRKNVFILLLIIASTLLFSCSSESSRTSNVKKVLESQAQVAESAPSSRPANDNISNGSSMKKQEQRAVPSHIYTNVDLDLTDYTSTVADAYLKQLQDNRDKYRGITVKAKGEYSHFKDPNTNKDYYNCIFASTCCTNGLEFILNDASNYPTEEGKAITVVGQFNYYEEDGVIYFNLVNAELV